MVYASPLAGLRVVSHGDTAELAKTILSVPQGIQVYPQRHRAKDPEFSADLEEALKLAGYVEGGPHLRL